MGKGNNIDIGARVGGANNFSIELVKLAVAALLRALITKHRAVGGKLYNAFLLHSFR